MDEVKVSVCLVTYNHERFIVDAVESALAQQTSFPFEIVVGEDCSTDRTADLLRELASRHPGVIRLRLAAQNEGPRKNIIGTIGDCRGQYIALLEGDDYWTSPHKLQRQAEALDARPDWALCFHPAKCVYENGLSGPAMLPEKWDRPEATVVDLLHENFISTNSVVFRNGLYAEYPEWYWRIKIGDWPLHILNAAHGNIGFLPEVMSVYRIHGEGMWAKEKLAGKLDAMFEMLSAVDHHFQGKYAAEIDAERRNVVRWLVRKLPGERSTPMSKHDRVVRELVRPWQQISKQVRQWWQRDDSTPPPSPAGKPSLAEKSSSAGKSQAA